ncbi:hypothetical protein DFH07DRAFT_833022 [Mycena maculata]|uniref:Uncharacterized protein n=1 Tax=Mycena maculata TaxID=230809 RepID=A0AAD7ILG2_9AGAR|nr:hypothetical protein DFH07DRAFT_833022 [Mycena maculata]
MPTTMSSTTQRMDSALVATWIQAIFYGLFVALFLGSYSAGALLPKHHDTGTSSRSVISGRVLLAVTVTAHFVYSLQRFREAFFLFNGRAAPFEIYSEYFRETAIWQNGFLLATVLVADLVLIRRLWRVRVAKRWLIASVISFLSLIICGGRAVHSFTLPGADTKLVAPWIIACGAFNVLTNILGGAALILPAPRHERSIELQTEGQITGPTSAVKYTDGAYLTSAWSVILFSAYFWDIDMRFPLDVTPAVLGISNMIVHLQMELAGRHADTT